MRAVIQRVKSASVQVEEETVGAIDKGLLCFVGIGQDDNEEDARLLAHKIADLRVFPDEQGKMSRSVLEETKQVLVVSQFTLYGDCRKGRRPNFMKAAAPDMAIKLYRHFIEELSKKGLEVREGKFGAMMDVSIVNDGPVTLLIDTEGTF